MKLVNSAAYLPSHNERLEVRTAPFPSAPGLDELIIKTSAVAINPVDWKIQLSGGFNITYPAVLGQDVAGEVLEVGKALEWKGESDVDVDAEAKGKFKKGDRVIAHAAGLSYGNAYGGFQLFVKVKGITCAKIPDALEMGDAVVLPLSVSTASAGLYLKGTLGLKYPEITSWTREAVDQRASQKKKNEVLLLWGGSSSVGSSVIQLAVASGYDVITTASPANYNYCRDLGASLVLDYHNPDIVDILIAVLKGYEVTVAKAYDAIGADATVRQCADVLHAFGGGTVASVVSAPDDLPKSVKVSRIGSGNIVSQEAGVVAKKVWGKYLPAALKDGSFKAMPEKLVVGEGLDAVQDGLDRQRMGVSARKVVVTL